MSVTLFNIENPNVVYNNSGSFKMSIDCDQCINCQTEVLPYNGPSISTFYFTPDTTY